MELLTLIPMSIWDPFIAIGSAIMQPLYWVVSGILVLAHSIFSPAARQPTAAGPGCCPSCS